MTRLNGCDGNRLLILGAGGGADLITVQMLREKAERESPKLEVHTAGWLNPKFDHFYRDHGENTWSFEQAVNGVGPCIRYRRPDPQADNLSHPAMEWYRRHGKEKPLAEEGLWRMMYSPSWHFSTRYGLSPVVNFLTQYDCVILCDIGGDILYSGPQDNEVRTPLLDAFSLCLLRRVISRRCLSNFRVFLLGIGTDGELSPKGIRHALGRLAHRGAIMESELLLVNDISVLHRYASILRDRDAGKTIALLLATWDAARNGTPVPIIGDRNMEPYREWFNTLLVIDGEALIQHNPLASANSFLELEQKAGSLGWTPQ